MIRRWIKITLSGCSLILLHQSLPVVLLFPLALLLAKVMPTFWTLVPLILTLVQCVVDSLHELLGFLFENL